MKIIYRAYAGTPIEKDFETKEDCLRYEERAVPKMWDRNGIRTFDDQEAYFVQIDEDCGFILFEEYGYNFPGITKDDEGVFFWDEFEEKFRYFDRDTFINCAQFFENHKELF